MGSGGQDSIAPHGTEARERASGPPGPAPGAAPQPPTADTPGAPVRPDRHVLYEAAVQGVEYDLDFLERVYRRHHGATFRRLREDFCGTAQLAGSWVIRRRENRAWAVDIDRATLDWVRTHRLPRLRAAATRLVLLERDVRAGASPKVDAIVALNFSYWVFKRRRDLLAYFRAARRSLAPGGIFCANAFGGTGALQKLVETSRISGSTSIEGDWVPPFTYVWEHRSFNPIDHHLECAIHFKLKDGRTLRNAFTYDWRLWTLPEIREAMLEAGFAETETYVEGWNARLDKPDDTYRLKRRFENQEGWLAYVVGLTGSKR